MCSHYLFSQVSQYNSILYLVIHHNRPQLPPWADLDPVAIKTNPFDLQAVPEDNFHQKATRGQCEDMAASQQHGC